MVLLPMGIAWYDAKPGVGESPRLYGMVAMQ